MKVKEIMSAELQGVRSDASVQDAAERMRALDVGSLPVVSPNGDRIVGLLTDRDIVVRSVARGDDVMQQKVGDIMSSPLVCCHEADDLQDASRTMKSKQVRRVLVLNEREQPVGILSVGDLAGSGIDAEEFTSLMRSVAAP